MCVEPSIAKIAYLLTEVTTVANLEAVSLMTCSIYHAPAVSFAAVNKSLKAETMRCHSPSESWVIADVESEIAATSARLLGDGENCLEIFLNCTITGLGA